MSRGQPVKHLGTSVQARAGLLVLHAHVVPDSVGSEGVVQSLQGRLRAVASDVEMRVAGLQLEARLGPFPSRTERLARGPSSFHPKSSSMSVTGRQGTQFLMCRTPGRVHEPIFPSPVENVTEPRSPNSRNSC